MKKLSDTVVEIKNLKMRYGSKEVLKGIDLNISKGQIIGYIGPNGAGKSTTIKILLGLINGYEGEVKVFGDNISSERIRYKQRIGYVPENGEVYDNLTGYEYITFLGEIYGIDLDTVNNKAKKMMGLFGIEEAYHSRISSYSKGMKQKFLIISSLIHNPDILFLDEPLSGLDANSVLVFKEVLASLASQGKTIFYSSHIMEVVEKISDRIILLNNGEIAADGTFKELKEKNKEGSLEEIFNQITGFTKHQDIANEFISVLREV